MNYIEQLANDKIKNSTKNVRIVFPEGNDPRVIETANMIFEKNIPITPILIGEENIIKENLKNNNVEIINSNNLINSELLNLFLEVRSGKITEIEAKELMQKPNYYATLMVEAGMADGMVGGCVYSTADILRPSFQIIKTKPGLKLVSSSFLMCKDDQNYLFGDCAVNIDPTAEELKDIAIATMDTANFLKINDPKVALLSFSTKGSAKHEMATKVFEATESLQKAGYNNVDGELQFDAAIDMAVGEQKAPGSNVAGKANIFIFPSIESGNIGYKIAQRMGGFAAVGPILQGLNKPVADLSRGANAQDIYLTSLIIYLQAV